MNISGMTFRDAALGGAIRVNDGKLNVSNATFTSNISNGNGGAIFGNSNSTLMLSNLVVMGNSAQGSAIDGYTIDIQDSVIKQNTGSGISAGTTMSIARCIISDNTGGGAGAEHLTIIDSAVTNNHGDGGVSDGDSISTMTIERCLISGNSRNPTGGGVKSTGMTVIKDSQIINNTAVNYGGGIVNAGTLFLINSNVSGNTSTPSGFGDDGGGGIESAIGRLYVINSTVSGNTAMGNPGNGGGIYILANSANPNGRLYIVNSTISNNTSAGAGGGIHIDSLGHGTFSNSIVAGNNSTGTTQEDVGGVIMSNGINLIGNTTGSSGWIAGDLLNVNPMLGPLADNGGSTMTHALLPGSPAINAGSNSVAIDPQTQMPLTGDQRGFQRFVDGAVDIGSFEVQPMIAGTIVYGNAVGSPTPRFVSGVSLSGAGSPNVSTTSLANGSYTLGGFGAGSYTVTPSKTGGVNGINSFDAGRVAAACSWDKCSYRQSVDRGGCQYEWDDQLI